MKKIIFPALLLLAAQFANSQKINWSGKVGLGVSNFTLPLYGDDDDRFKPLLSYSLGVQAEIPLTSTLALQPELLLRGEGAKTSFHNEDDTSEFDVSEKLRLHYVSLPVLLKWSLSKKWSIEGGPQVGYLIAAKDSYEMKGIVEGAPVNTSGTEDVKDNFHQFNLDAVLGSTYNISENIYLQLRLNKGIPNINNGQSEAGIGSSKVRTSGAQFSVGYRF
ncbi:porin family protein [Flavobacterium wongokense]|uniref:porin family protein n=1 Tax=Flavobacterium wongokense TaxID=2910674 RepID=UPI001F2093C6|nr:porin family protein [Flavobacterium sp. WG47]MCF6132791.1 PorT family protein [Flavobacterium sp. WG47]